MNVALRPASGTDLEFVRGVHHEAFRELVERQFGPWDAALQHQLLAQAWARGGYSIVVYDGEPCGYFCLEQGTAVRLRTNRANYRAVSLYRRLGFQNLGQTTTHLLFEWRGWLPSPLTIGLHPEEPAAGPWREERIVDVFARFGSRTQRTTARPLVVAIDGRSSSGKATLAARVACVVPATAVVHTDDIAWWHSRFGWADLAEQVLETVRAREALSFRPPAWIERGREGAIAVPGGIQVLVLEGVRASRDELAHLLDARVSVPTDRMDIDRRNEARGADEGWLEEELPWIADHRPWEHADLVIAGSPTLSHDPDLEVVVADGQL